MVDVSDKQYEISHGAIYSLHHRLREEKNVFPFLLLIIRYQIQK